MRCWLSCISDVCHPSDRASLINIPHILHTRDTHLKYFIMWLDRHRPHFLLAKNLEMSLSFIAAQSNWPMGCAVCVWLATRQYSSPNEKLPFFFKFFFSGTNRKFWCAVDTWANCLYCANHLTEINFDGWNSEHQWQHHLNAQLLCTVEKRSEKIRLFVCCFFF